MKMKIETYKKDNNLFKLNIRILLKDEIGFLFRSIYLLKSERLIINTPFIKTNTGKKIAFIFSDELKNYISYHVIKNLKDNNNVIFFKWKENQNIQLKKVNKFERNYGFYETKGIYNIFVRKSIQIKYINLILKNNKYKITFPNNGNGKDICFPINNDTRLLVKNKMIKLLA